MVFEPTRRYWRDDTRVTDSPVPVRVTAGQTATADLDPTGGTWCYAVTWTPDGDALPWTEYVLVPAGLEPVEYRDLLKLTRDAAAVLTGERALTAAAALARMDAALADARAAVGNAREAATEAATEAASAAVNTLDATVRDVIARMEAGEFVGEPGEPGRDRTFTGGTRLTLHSEAPVIVPAGFDVVVVPPVAAAKPLAFETVTLQDGTKNPDGASVVLHFERGAQHLQFPGGTRHSGEPPADVPVWATAILLGGVWWLVWPPAPTASAGTGAAPVRLSVGTGGMLEAATATQVGSMGQPAPAAGLESRPLLIRTDDDATSWAWLAGQLLWAQTYTSTALNAVVRLAIAQSGPDSAQLSVHLFPVTAGTTAPAAVRLFVPNAVVLKADVLLHPFRTFLDLGSDTKMTRADGVQGWATTLKAGTVYTTSLRREPLYLSDTDLTRGVLRWPTGAGISLEAAA